jgi:hypothetical protein
MNEHHCCISVLSESELLAVHTMDSYVFFNLHISQGKKLILSCSNVISRLMTVMCGAWLQEAPQMHNHVWLLKNENSHFSQKI